MSKRKSLYKTITWRITASLTTIIIVYSVTRRIEIAGTIALLEILIKMVVYYFHERVWERISS